MTTEKETGLVLNATQYGLEPSKAEMLEATFAPMVAKFKELETDYATVKGKPISKDVCAEAKRVRLAYVKVRTGTDDLHKKAKEDLLIQTRAIDGIRNIVKFACNDHESDLEKLEKHFENLEAERKAKLKSDRENELAPYEVDTQFVNLGDMPDEVWQNYFNGAKASFEQKKEAERKAEEEWVERERVDLLHNERKESLLPFWSFVPEAFKALNMGMVTEMEFRSVSEDAKKAKADHDAEQERIRQENEKLKEAAEEKERLEAQKIDRQNRLIKLGLRFDGEQFCYKDINFHWTDIVTMTGPEFAKQFDGATQRMEVLKKEEQAEVEAKEAADKKEKEDREALLQKERDEKSRLEAELKAKQDAEEQAKKDADAMAKAEEQAKKRQEKAPKKRRLTAWIDDATITPPSGLENEETVIEILAKFESFKVWAKTKVDNL